MGRQIDPKDVQTAQNALVLSGGNIKEAAGASGISETRIRRYMDRGLIDRNIKFDAKDQREALEVFTQERNEALANKMLELGELAVDQARAEIHGASAYQAAGIAGLMVDKAQTLKGKPNKRVELTVTSDLDVLRRHGIIIEADPEDVVEIIEAV